MDFTVYYEVVVVFFYFVSYMKNINLIAIISAERIEEVNKFLQNYLGTHNFYNFTSGR